MHATQKLECIPRTLLGGSGVVISGVISPLIWVISIVTLRRQFAQAISGPVGLI